MIAIDIDCPFSINESVYIIEEKQLFEEIECPFCHGDFRYDTGRYKISKSKGIEYNKSEREVVPWIIYCKTCGGTGKIRTLSKEDLVLIEGVVIGIHSVNSLDWRQIEYNVIINNATIKHYPGYSILTKDQIPEMMELLNNKEKAKIDTNIENKEVVL